MTTSPSPRSTSLWHAHKCSAMFSRNCARIFISVRSMCCYLTHACYRYIATDEGLSTSRNVLHETSNKKNWSVSNHYLTMSAPDYHFLNSYISFHHWFIPHGNISTHKWPTPNVSGFIAQLVRASHRYREVTGSNPVEVLNFSCFSTQLQKLRS